MTEIELRNIVCDWARSWLGRKEDDGSYREIIDIYNMGRPKGTYRMTYDDPWCAAFVSAVGMAVEVHNGLMCNPLLPHVNCDGMIAAYRAAGQWQEADDYQAQIGDVIFYDWSDSGTGDCTGSADHVGLIVGVGESAYTVIEGNISDAVGYRTVYRNQRYIRGFACPDYAAAAGIKATPSTAPDKKKLVSGLPLLKFGSKGVPVVAMQGVLIARGYSCGPDGADGDFGYNTQNAVGRFQKDFGLTVDKKVGDETWTALMLRAGRG